MSLIEMVWESKGDKKFGFGNVRLRGVLDIRMEMFNSLYEFGV